MTYPRHKRHLVKVNSFKVSLNEPQDADFNALCDRFDLERGAMGRECVLVMAGLAELLPKCKRPLDVLEAIKQIIFEYDLERLIDESEVSRRKTH